MPACLLSSLLRPSTLVRYVHTCLCVYVCVLKRVLANCLLNAHTAPSHFLPSFCAPGAVAGFLTRRSERTPSGTPRTSGVSLLVAPCSLDYLQQGTCTHASSLKSQHPSKQGAISAATCLFMATFIHDSVLPHSQGGLRLCKPRLPRAVHCTPACGHR